MKYKTPLGFQIGVDFSHIDHPGVRYVPQLDIILN